MSSRPIRLAINGYGRIGRCFLRALHEAGLESLFQVVAINEPANAESIAYLTRFDSTHGRFPLPVSLEGETLQLGDQSIQLTHADGPEGVDWRSLKIDLLVECSGQYSNRAGLRRFVDAGCPRVLLSHPANSAFDVDATVVFGLNHGALEGDERIVSNASCTTNAVVPVLDLLQREVGLDQVLLTTLHSAMNDQPVADGYHHSDLRRTRSAMQSIIPVSTGLARGVERLLPALAGKVQAKAIRVPTLNVSAIDLVVTLNRDCAAAEINALLCEAAQGPWQGILSTATEPNASIDFNHDPHSAIVDTTLTRAIGPRLINLFIWFDNEWGFANRMLDVARCWQRAWEQPRD